MPLDALGAEHLAEPVHVHLERRDGGPRGLGAPESVDDPVSRCDRVRVQEQEGQQGALLRRSQRERPFVPDDLDGSQDAELDPFDPLSQADAKWLLSARLDGAPDPNDRKEHYMIHAGDTIHNPVTGERIVFRQTSRETNGEAVVIETFVQPNGFVAAAHVHPSQEERFEVLRGSVGFKVGRKKLVAGPGRRLTVPAGTPHRFWNAGDEEAHFVCEVRPALQFEALLETMFALAADGKTNRKGMPNPFRLAVIANAHFDTVRLPFPPALVQRIGLALGAPLGRALGYKPVYVPAEPAPVAVAASL
jgi:quercetin dioxygenase-like cupin family protein